MKQPFWNTPKQPSNKIWTITNPVSGTGEFGRQSQGGIAMSANGEIVSIGIRQTPIAPSSRGGVAVFNSATRTFLGSYLYPASSFSFPFFYRQSVSPDGSKIAGIIFGGNANDYRAVVLNASNASLYWEISGLPLLSDACIISADNSTIGIPYSTGAFSYMRTYDIASKTLLREWTGTNQNPNYSNFTLQGNSVVKSLTNSNTNVSSTEIYDVRTAALLKTIPVPSGVNVVTFQISSDRSCYLRVVSESGSYVCKQYKFSDDSLIFQKNLGTTYPSIFPSFDLKTAVNIGSGNGYFLTLTDNQPSILFSTTPSGQTLTRWLSGSGTTIFESETWGLLNEAYQY